MATTEPTRHGALGAAHRHAPVLLRTCVELLEPALRREGAVHVDATLGMGGHAQAVLEAAPHARLVGIDRDAEALELARTRLEEAGLGSRIHLVHATYDRIPEVLDELGIAGADGVMMDLGLSSFQIDTAERGFSYMEDAPLDMRMDTTPGTSTAADLLRESDEAELARILHEYGDERFSRRIARRIVAERKVEPIATSGRLVRLLEDAIPAATRRTGGHPAKRTFQALRIAVNEELTILADALEGVLQRTALGGRVVVESYHSGEDRLVKSAFARRTRSSAPAGLPVELDEHRPRFQNLVRGALRADDTEQTSNPRSASVRLRAVERVRENS